MKNDQCNNSLPLKKAMPKLIKTATEFKLSPTLAANELVAARRAKGEQVLQMGFGQSPFPVPPRLQKALGDAAHRKEYLPTVGLRELREAVSSYYKEKTSLDTDQYDVIIAPGSKLILYALQMAVKGDLILPVPNWVSYAPQAKMLHTGIINISAQLDNDGYHIDSEELRATILQARKEGKNPGKIILNYPNNPTGLTIPENELEVLAKVCVEEDILIISDEIYGLINFNNTYHTIAKYAPTHTAITTGLSKHLSLGGWRVGIGFIPKAIDGLQGLLSNIASETWACVSAPIQQAVTEAYKGHEDIENHIKDCTAIHNFMSQYVSEGLRQLGVSVPAPRGAFYNYPDFNFLRSALAQNGIKTSKELTDVILKDYGMVTLPGTAFGAAPEVLTLRISACDYDGTTVLKAYQDGETLNHDFVIKNAPHIEMALKAFRQFIQDIQQAASSN